MWIDLLKMFMLAQTEQEKRMTFFGLIFVGFFFFVLVLDSLAKGKLIRKKGPLKKNNHFCVHNYIDCCNFVAIYL